MRIKIIAVGKTKEPFARMGIEHYEARIRRLAPFSYVEVRDEKHLGGRESRPALGREAAKVLKQVGDRGLLAVLDARGEMKSSEALADWLKEATRKGAPEVAFVVGGPWGIDATVRGRANLILSLSPMTLAHDLARVVLFEQVYRALSILRDSPYHHGG